MDNQFKFNLSSVQLAQKLNLHIYGTANCPKCPLRARGMCNKNPPDPPDKDTSQPLSQEEASVTHP